MFRPWFGQALTVVIAVLSAVGLAGFTWQRGIPDGMRLAPFVALFAGACWALFWRPAVVVDDAGVRLVNVVRTVALPWPSIQQVDTKWALTLVTAYGEFRAWAAPAPGAAHVVRAGRPSRRDARQLPASTFGADGIRPGDLPTSPSGGAALVIRERWERLRDAGHLDDPRLEHTHAPVTWHRSVIVGAAVLLVLCGVSLMV